MAYNVEQINAKLADFGEWFLDEENLKLYTGFEFENFDQAVDFLNAVAEIGADLGHYPDMYIYDERFLQVFVPAESEAGFSDADLELLEAIDDLFSDIEQDIHVEEADVDKIADLVKKVAE
jgi:pterin-4a-carbinolamine dehydratase